MLDPASPLSWLDDIGTASTSALVIGDLGEEEVAGVAARYRCATVIDLGTADSLQHEQRFDVVAVIDTEPDTAPAVRRAAMHCAVQHLAPHGRLIVLHGPDDHLADFGFRSTDFVPEGTRRLGSHDLSVFRRGTRVTVHDLLYAARSMIRRVSPRDLSIRMEEPDPPLVIDTRAHVDRVRFGIIPRSIHIPRTVVEWQLDPANGYLHPAVASFERPLVVVCNSGYSSSLAAANLVHIGYSDVADLVGGHMAWCAAGLAVELADHSHVESLRGPHTSPSNESTPSSDTSEAATPPKRIGRHWIEM